MLCVLIRGTWQSWLWQLMWGTCCSSTPACCLRDAFSSLPVNSAPYVICYQRSYNTHKPRNVLRNDAYWSQLIELNSIYIIPQWQNCSVPAATYIQIGHYRWDALLSESVSICSWHLAYTHWVLHCIPCIGSTSSSLYCHHICWTTAGKLAPHLFLCSLERKVYLFLRLFYGCSAPMPYLIGVHTSLSEVILQF